MSKPLPADIIKARSDAEAKARFLRFLNASLSAVSDAAIWRVMPIAKMPGELVAFTVPEVLRLPTAEDFLFLRATLRFTYVDHAERRGERKVETHEYAYTVGQSETLKPELYSWEWQPGPWPAPHVHVGRSNPQFEGLGKLHIPTARVAFEQVLKFLLTDHGVYPSRALGPTDEQRHLKAHALLDESLRRFMAFKTW